MNGHAVARVPCVGLAVAVSAVGCGNEPAPTATTEPSQGRTSTELRLDPAAETGRQRTKILTYAVRPGHLLLTLIYSTGQRVREVRFHRRSPRVLIADAVLTQQGPQDLRIGCVSVRWEAPADVKMLQRGRLVDRAKGRSARCQPTAVVDANTRVDGNLLPPDHPLAETP